MISLTMQPSLSELSRFIAKVRDYPVSVRQLLKLASDKGAPKGVINFYRSFASDQVFEDEEDLAGRTEQLAIMHEEKREMPEEFERAPEEY